MGKYIKKPVVIEAYKYRKDTNELNILSFIKCGDYNNLDCLPKSYQMYIKILPSHLYKLILQKE